MQQKSITQFILIGMLCLLLVACGTRNGVVFDPAKAHHGDGEFTSVKQGSFFGHFMMRLREDDPPVRDRVEIKSIVGVADRQLLGTYAAQPRVTWIGHATSLVQYQGISYLTDPHLTQYPFYYEVHVEPRYTQPELALGRQRICGHFFIPDSSVRKRPPSVRWIGVSGTYNAAMIPLLAPATDYH